MKSILFNTEMVRAILDGRKTVIRRVLKTEKYIPDDAVFGYTGFTPKGYISCRGTFVDENGNKRYGENYIKMPYQIGDILYVREAWNKGYFENSDSEYSNECWFEEASVQDGDYLKALTTYVYRADFKWQDEINLGMKWHPSIHMPKEAARIFLRVISVRVERLQDSFFKSGSTIFTLLREGIDIGEQCRDCIDTYGSPCCIDDESECGTLDEVRSDYSDLWNSTIKKSDLDKYGWVANPWVWVIEFERISKEEATK